MSIYRKWKDKECRDKVVEWQKKKFDRQWKVEKQQQIKKVDQKGAIMFSGGENVQTSSGAGKGGVSHHFGWAEFRYKRSFKACELVVLFAKLFPFSFMKYSSSLCMTYNNMASQVEEELKGRLTSATKGFEVSNMDNLYVDRDGKGTCDVVNER